MNKSNLAVTWFLLGAVACSGQIPSNEANSDSNAAGRDRDVAAGGNSAPAAAEGKASPNNGPASTGGPGLLDCPTVDYPGTTSATVSLSPEFVRNCGACHGGSGEGKGRYPALPGKLSQTEFIAKVRAGAENMPSYDTAFMNDSLLKQDYEALATRTKAGETSVHPSFKWTDAQVQEKRAVGMALWRKPDKDGAACASCHSADAIDLAVIGYPDAAILRRGTLHQPADVTIKIVDFVHAQRRHFKITRPCSPQWQVLQPGGEVLPGNTVKEQDDSFWGELIKRNFLVATGKVQTLQDADTAWNELANLNMRRMRIGIPLARWTSDGFNGDEFKSINDWMTAVPRMPNNEQWYATVDAYLADPTASRMVTMLKNIEDQTNDGGFSKKPWADSDLNSLMVSKYHSVQIASHYFRMALLGKPGWFESADSAPEVPSTRGEGTNSPFQGIGFSYQENHCYNQEQCPPGQFKALPPFAQSEFDPKIATVLSGSGGIGFNAILQKELTHSWWTLGGVWDASFGGGRSLVMHYWLENSLPQGGVNFPQRTFHRPFIAAVAMVKRAVKLELSKVAPSVPGELAGNIMMGFENTVGSAMGETPDSTRMVANVMRMLLLRQQRALSKGGSTLNVQALTSGNGQGGWATDLEMAAKKPGSDSTLLLNTAALAREVIGQLGRAKTVTVPSGYQMPE